MNVALTAEENLQSFFNLSGGDSIEGYEADIAVTFEHLLEGRHCLVQLMLIVGFHTIISKSLEGF